MAPKKKNESKARKPAEKKTTPAAATVAEPTVPLPTPEPEGNHNGHDDPNANKKLSWDQIRELAPTLTDDHFSKAFTSQRTSNAIDKLVERGEDEREFWLRGNFKDPNHLNSCAILLMLAGHYEDNELKQLVFNHMAGYPAIGEGRIQDLVKAIIGDMESRKKLNPFGFKNLWENVTGNGSKNGAGDKSG